MKRNHVRWLTAIITTALLLLGAGLPAKAQLVVSDPTVIASDVVNLGKEIAQAKRQFNEFVDVYNKVSDLVSGFRSVKEAKKALEDLSRIPDSILRNQRNVKYLSDSEKIRSFKETDAIFSNCLDLLSEIQEIAEPTSSSSSRLTEGDRLSVIRDLCDKVVALRDKAYRIVKDYDRIAMGREARANTRRMINRLNGYKSR